MKKISILFALLALAAGCKKDTVLPASQDTETGEAVVTLKLQFPGDYTPATRSTRALLDPADENIVDSVDVLVFESATGTTAATLPTTLKLKKTQTRVRSAVTITQTNGKYTGTFKISLKATPTTPATTRTKLVVLANCHDALAAHGFNGGTAQANHTVFAQDATYEAVSKGLWSKASDVRMLGDSLGAGEYEPKKLIPMWGETDVLQIGSDTTLPELKLTRGLARIDIGVGHHYWGGGENEYDHVNLYWDHAVEKLDVTKNNHPAIRDYINAPVRKNEFVPFQMTEVYVVSPSNHYMPIPLAANLNASKVATKPSVQATSAATGAGLVTVANSITNWKYANKDYNTHITTFNSDSVRLLAEEYAYGWMFAVDNMMGATSYGGACTRSIYVPESAIQNADATAAPGDANHEKRTAIVVGGVYDPFHNTANTKTYYRVDFIKGGELVDILRNHQYIFDITSVAGPGQPSVDEAYAARTSKMTVSMVDWVETEMDDVELVR